MRKAVIALPALLLGCASAPAPAPVHGATAGRTCASNALDQFAGQAASAELGAAILRASGASVLRWVPHGAMVTMEFRADRVSVWLTTANRVERVSCG